MNKSRTSQQQQPTTSPIREDVGLGTAYERLAAYRLIETWVADQPLCTAFEGPVDGMAGISGLHLLPLARRGTRVTVASTSQEASDRVRQTYARCGLTGNLEAVCLDQPPKAGTFGLVLSFNALPLVHRWRDYLGTLAACTARFLLVVLTNPHSYGVGLRRGLRFLERGEHLPELFDHESVRAGVLESELRRIGDIVRTAYLDCPWWPDLFVPVGQTLREGALSRLGLGDPRSRETRPKGRFVYGPNSFPYGDPGSLSALRRALRWHPTFDGGHRLLGRLFGHHRAYLVDVTARGTDARLTQRKLAETAAKKAP